MPDQTVYLTGCSNNQSHSPATGLKYRAHFCQQGSDLSLVSVAAQLPAGGSSRGCVERRADARIGVTTNVQSRDCDILPSKRVQLFSTCVSLTVPPSLGRVIDTFIQSGFSNSESILYILREEKQLNLAQTWNRSSRFIRRPLTLKMPFCDS